MGKCSFGKLLIWISLSTVCMYCCDWEQNWVRLLDESTLDDPHKISALLWLPIDSHSKDIADNIELTDTTKGIEGTNWYNFLHHNF